MAVLLGEVDVPDGILIILDPGLARFWRHDGDPRSPRRGEQPGFDLEMVGDDALAAGKAYDREFDPRYLFDRTDPAAAAKHFETFAQERGFAAHAAVLDKRIVHVERARRAIEVGDGLGVVKYNGLWAVAAGGLPTDRKLRVVGTTMTGTEFADRWRHVDIEVEAEAAVATRQEVEGVMVDHGQLLVAGLEPLGRFRMWESLDGLADFVFWGPDAEGLAGEVGASRLDDKLFGWRDVAIDAIGTHAQPVQTRVAERELRVGIDYRPHCNGERLNAALRASELDAAEIDLEGASVVGFGNRWGDGIFAVSRHLAADGRVVRIRLEIGTEKRQAMMREVKLRAAVAIVSRSIVDDGEPLRFAERVDPNDPKDSGWSFCSGAEDDAHMNDPNGFVLERLGNLIKMFPELADIVHAPFDSAFRRNRDGEPFVADED